MRETIKERLLSRLRAEGVDLPPGTKLERIYSSPAQRQAEAWSWFALGPDGSDLCVGSQHSMTKLLLMPRWDISTTKEGDTWIDRPVTSTD